jgi:hypothetical protein
VKAIVIKHNFVPREKNMQPRIKVGLLVGVIGLVLNVCVAGFIGICGPLVSLLAGALAGFFTARQEKPAVKSAGAQAGAISGAVAGALVLIGQVLGGAGALAYMQFSGARSPFGQIPSTAADPSQQVIFYLTGIGTACCFGLVGVALGALTGAGAGYLGTPEQPLASNPQ